MQGLTHRVADEIERYCVAHPEARDTVEGIAWWVQLQRQEDLRNTLPEAIRLLIDQGVLERFAAPNGAEFFGFNSTGKRTSRGA